MVNAGPFRRWVVHAAFHDVAVHHFVHVNLNLGVTRNFQSLEELRTALFDCDPELQGLLCLSDIPATEFEDVSDDLATGSESTIASSSPSSNRDPRGKP